MDDAWHAGCRNCIDTDFCDRSVIALVAGIGTFVVSIMKIVYLRQTAKTLEGYE